MKSMQPKSARRVSFDLPDELPDELPIENDALHKEIFAENIKLTANVVAAFSCGVLTFMNTSWADRPVDDHYLRSLCASTAMIFSYCVIAKTGLIDVAIDAAVDVVIKNINPKSVNKLST